MSAFIMRKTLISYLLVLLTAHATLAERLVLACSELCYFSNNLGFEQYLLEDCECSSEHQSYSQSFQIDGNAGIPIEPYDDIHTVQRISIIQPPLIVVNPTLKVYPDSKHVRIRKESQKSKQLSTRKVKHQHNFKIYKKINRLRSYLDIDIRDLKEYDKSTYDRFDISISEEMFTNCVNALRFLNIEQNVSDTQNKLLNTLKINNVTDSENVKILKNKCRRLADAIRRSLQEIKKSWRKIKLATNRTETRPLLDSKEEISAHSEDNFYTDKNNASTKNNKKTFKTNEDQNSQFAKIPEHEKTLELSEDIPDIKLLTSIIPGSNSNNNNEAHPDTNKSSTSESEREITRKALETNLNYDRPYSTVSPVTITNDILMFNDNLEHLFRQKEVIAETSNNEEIVTPLHKLKSSQITLNSLDFDKSIVNNNSYLDQRTENANIYSYRMKEDSTDIIKVFSFTTSGNVENLPRTLSHTSEFPVILQNYTSNNTVKSDTERFEDDSLTTERYEDNSSSTSSYSFRTDIQNMNSKDVRTSQFRRIATFPYTEISDELNTDSHRNALNIDENNMNIKVNRELENILINEKGLSTVTSKKEEASKISINSRAHVTSFDYDTVSDMTSTKHVFVLTNDKSNNDTIKSSYKKHSKLHDRQTETTTNIPVNENSFRTRHVYYQVDRKATSSSFGNIDLNKNITSTRHDLHIRDVVINISTTTDKKIHSMIISDKQFDNKFLQGSAKSEQNDATAHHGLFLQNQHGTLDRGSGNRHVIIKNKGHGTIRNSSQIVNDLQGVVTYSEKDIRINNVITREFQNNTVVSEIQGSEIVNNNNSKDSLRLETVATLIDDNNNKISIIASDNVSIHGNLYFQFKKSLIPARFVQDNKGKLSISIDGDKICARLNPDENKSILLSIICNCVKNNYCPTSMESPNLLLPAMLKNKATHSHPKLAFWSTPNNKKSTGHWRHIIMKDCHR